MYMPAFPFRAIDMAGFLIDTLRGATMSTLFNPCMGMESSIFGVLFTQLLTVLFLISGGFILGVNQSFGATIECFLPGDAD